MIDREYVKLNTSIQTASNTQGLIFDSEGNKKATIELRLPDNLFAASSGGKKIDHVSMATSKLRLSMENTPIASIPLDSKLTTDTMKVSSCQLDVYPYCLLDDGVIKPSPTNANEVKAFPDYKSHMVTYVINLYTSMSPPASTEIDTITTRANMDAYKFPTTNRFYPVVEKAKLLRFDTHIMNLCAQSNHENYTIEDGQLMIRNIGTLEQMLQDALENAITYACTNDNEIIYVDLIDSRVVPQGLSVDATNSIDLSDIGVPLAYFWKWSKNSVDSELRTSLLAAVKPRVSLTEQSLKISYDTAAFQDLIPIIWNTPFVNTYDQPEQMTMDELRNEVWNAPPPKRVYKYSVNSTPEDGYQFALSNNINCAAMNIIANRAFKDVFSFLPWITIDTRTIDAFNPHPPGTLLYKIIKENRYVLEESTSTTYNIANNGRRYYWAINGKQQEAEDLPEGAPVGYYFLHYYTLRDDGVQGNQETYYDQYIDMGTPINNPLRNETINSGDAILTSSYSTPERKIPPPPEVTGTLYTSAPHTIGEETHIPPDTTDITNTDTTLTGIVNGKWHEYSNDGGTTWGCIYPGRVGDIGNWLSPAPITYPSDIKGTIPWWQPDFTAFPTDVYTAQGAQYYKEGWFLSADGEGLNQIPFIRSTGSSGDIASTRNNVLHTTSYLTTQKWEVVYDNIAEKSQLVRPNLTIDDGKFYMLDGTTAEVTIGPQEVIDVGRIAKFEIDETKDFLNEQADHYVEFLTSSASPTYANPGQLQTYQFAYDPSNEYEYHDQSQTLTNVIYRIRTEEIESGNVSYEVVYGSSPPMRGTLESQIDAPRESDITGSYHEHGEQPESQHRITYSDDSSLVPGTTTTTDYTYNENVSDPAIGSEHIVIKHFYLEVDDETYETNAFYGPDQFPQADWPDNEFACYYPNTSPQFTDSWEITGRYRISVYGWYLTWHQNYNAVAEIQRKVHFNNTIDRLTTTTTTTITEMPVNYQGNIRLTFTWNNLPMVVLSPIQSIVLTLKGYQVNQEYQPVNMTQSTGSSLTASLPIIENYYSFAQTLRDLHDELVVVKDGYNDLATYTLPTTVGQERVIMLTAMYITKDGKAHEIYIPPNGVFSLQLTFGVSFYYTS